MNASGAVEIEVEGPREALVRFCEELRDHPPPLAQTRAVVIREVEPRGFGGFQIRTSENGRGRVAPSERALVPPDVAMCPACRAEVENPKDRHHAYPFTNCTNCGPRFTILRALPYDRANTSMTAFPMCPSCAAEYYHPADRRFHAQPTACPDCGPQVALASARRAHHAEPVAPQEVVECSWVREFRAAVASGQIVALKGVGGFHLACDALNEEAVLKLRRRKNRPHKPFAVMGRDVEILSRFVELSQAEKDALAGPAAPIVLARRHAERSGDGAPSVAPSVAPGLGTLGVMIAYSPLHRMLFGDGVELLVMTSGNRTGLPLAASNEEALAQLGEIADLFVLHDREIVNRADDSVVAEIGGEVRLIRRSRGYVPGAVWLEPSFSSPPARARRGLPAPCPPAPAVIGMGGEMKNTFCLLAGDEAFLSQHIGDMETAESHAFYCDAVDKLCRLLDIKPRFVARDSHPGYVSRRLAGRLGFREGGPDATVVDVQHHHAHMVSCQAENGLAGPTLAAVLDGTGYGDDGNLWGFEILAGDAAGYQRLCRQRYVPLPGGEAAIRRPWAAALSYLVQALGTEGAREVGKLLFGGWGREVDAVIKLAQSPRSPLASGAGRLLDAAAALVGVCLEATYEGQPAIELGEVVDDAALGSAESYPWSMERQPAEGAGVWAPVVLDFTTLVAALAEDRLRGVPSGVMAAKVHLAVVEAVVEAIELGSRATGLRDVVLSGGVWQNPRLTRLAVTALRQRSYSVYCHRLVPANDGGIALGQAVVARRRWFDRVSGCSGPGGGAD